MATGSIDNAAFPIVGDPKKAYDIISIAVADAKAAVDEAVRLGVADPDRIGVTGHSHGALMTNLVGHSACLELRCHQRFIQ
ncbi:MAG: prolyl oligopeptidase family serine peptidase [Candidatus Obscuribacterales bacterium]